MSAAPNDAPIILVTHEFFPFRGGIATYAREIAAAAARAGRQIEVWAPHDRALEPANFEYPVNAMPHAGTQGPLARAALLRWMWARRAQIADSTLYLPEPGPIRAWMYGGERLVAPPRSLVLTLHGSEIVKLARWPHRRAAFARLLRRCNRVGVVSAYVRALLDRTVPGHGADVVLAPGAPGSDPQSHHCGAHLVSQSCDTQPHDTGRDKGRLDLLTVARIHPRKGQLEVVEALAGLTRSQRERIRYRVVGPVKDHSYRTRLERAARQSGVDLVLTGAVDETELGRLYRTSDIFIMASRDAGASVEGLGLTYLEAAARGLPCIAHRSGGAPEAVLDGETGLIVDPHDRQALGDAIVRLGGDAGLRARMGARGTEHARSFTWAATQAALFDGL